MDATMTAPPGSTPARRRLGGWWRGAEERTSLLEPGRNVWCVAEAERAALLYDGAGYFGALREAMKRARRSIHVIGWDIDSRARLVDATGRAEDGLPEALAPFLCALVRRNPALSVRLLLWDFAVLYALERERLPGLALQWATPPQVEFCLDDEMPFGCSQHQKIVVIDDRIAFVGGLDVTIRRWDSPAHEPDNPLRLDPAGEPYPPFHDMQMLVEGEAARALARLARRRWARAACEAPAALAPLDGPSPWPEGLAPDFTRIRLGIARTEPAPHEGAEEVREVEALFLDMIGAAERAIYIENQFLTSMPIAEALIERLAACPALEVLIVLPRTQHTWFEHRAMIQGRIRFRDRLIEAGFGERVRLVHPAVRGEAVMVHAKVMIVDDRFLRVGSANLCNRSMGTDSECDLVIEARSEAERAAIRAQRARLIGEHCGAAPEEAEAALEAGLFAALARLSGREAALLPLEDGPADPRALPEIAEMADPERPLLTDPAPRDRRARLLLLGGVGLMIVLATLAWMHTPLSALLSPEALQRSLVAGGAWGPLIALGFFLVLGLIAFPINVLIAGTAVAFGLWPGLLYAAAGAMVSALATYALGRRIGSAPLRRLLGPRVNRISHGIAKNGILAVTMVRLMPIAPFTLVNLVAGAMRIRVLDYTLGTLLGLAPGLVLMTAVGDRLPAMMSNPSMGDIVGFTAIVLAWIGVSFVMQYLVRRLRRARDAAA